LGNKIDLVIRGGLVVDGSGSPPIPADIAVHDGKILEIGKVDAEAHEVIDAEGHAVSPGFVDVHTHYDAQIFWDPGLTPSSQHGVTTVFGGNCGFSIAPLSGKKADGEYMMSMLARVEGMNLDSLREGVPWDWTSFGSYLGKLDGRTALNAGFMVGHSALRRAVMGERAVGHKATDEELTAMQALLRQSLSEGGLGFSSTYSPTHNDAEGEPVPSRWSSEEELLSLCRVLREFEGTYLEFIPCVGRFDDAMLERMTNMSLAAQRPLNWNLLSVDARKSEIYEQQLGASNYARARGGEVLALATAQPPSVIISLAIGMVFDAIPGWADVMTKPRPERRRLLSDPKIRQELNAAMQGPKADAFIAFRDWSAWTIVETSNPENKHLEGTRVGALASAQNKSPFDAMVDLAVSEDLETKFSPHPGGDDSASWRERGRIFLDDRTIVGGSDAGAHLDMIDTFAYSTYLLARSFRDRKLLTLEQAVHLLTDRPASLFGLRNRGLLKKGYSADIVIFDPDRIDSGPLHTRHDLPAGGYRLYREAIGVKSTIVNGVEIMRDQVATGKLPGKVLRSGNDTYTVAIGGAQ